LKTQLHARNAHWKRVSQRSLRNTFLTLHFGKMMISKRLWFYAFIRFSPNCIWLIKNPFQPYKELLVMPKRGSLAFWHDLDARGFSLQETHHGGCPVLKGSKWILNKWVYYFNQFKNYPCGLDAFKKFPAPSGFYR